MFPPVFFLGEKWGAFFPPKNSPWEKNPIWFGLFPKNFKTGSKFHKAPKHAPCGEAPLFPILFPQI